MGTWKFLVLFLEAPPLRAPGWFWTRAAPLLRGAAGSPWSGLCEGGVGSRAASRDHLFLLCVQAPQPPGETTWAVLGRWRGWSFGRGAFGGCTVSAEGATKPFLSSPRLLGKQFLSAGWCPSPGTLLHSWHFSQGSGRAQKGLAQPLWFPFLWLPLHVLPCPRCLP